VKRSLVIGHGSHGREMISDPSQGEARRYFLPKREAEAFLSLSNAFQPYEVCGLLLAREIRRYTFLSFAQTSMASNTGSSFRISRSEISDMEARLQGSPLRVCGCAHSHVSAAAYPSRRDAQSVKESMNLWLIASVAYRHLKLYEWDGNRFVRTRLRIRSFPANEYETGRC
jgi:proteasome lid subunit RPN8/RPN11